MSPQNAKDGTYQVPPACIRDIVETPSQPGLSITPDRKRVLQLARPPPQPPIAELCRPELKLAGVTIDAEIWARSRMSYTTALSVSPLGGDVLLPNDSGVSVTGIPPGMVINSPSFSRDSSHVVFTIRSLGGVGDPPRGPLELWMADMTTGAARAVLPPGAGLNAIFQDYAWLDEEHVVVCLIPEDVGPPPVRSELPTGPSVQDNSDGKKSQNRTYQDLLKDDTDCALFRYYTTSALERVNIHTGERQPLGSPGMYTSIGASPDGRFLVASQLQEPFSYTVPAGRFPKLVEVWDRDGSVVHEVARLPLADDIPIDFDSCRQGVRSLCWRDDKPAELCWIEAQDGGDPKREASPRDIVYTLPVLEDMADAAPQVLTTSELRCDGLAWCDNDLAIMQESWWATRRSVTHLLAPGRPQEPSSVLFDRNYEDVYDDPGTPVSRRTGRGTYILAKVDGARKLLLSGAGCAPEGKRPFLDVLDLDSRETQRIWHSPESRLESVGSLISDATEEAISLDSLAFLSSHQTTQEPPQYSIRSFSAGGSEVSDRLITDYPHPYPSLRDLQKEVLRYKRDDGVDLTATLYLPPGYDAETDGPLPCLLWAYPREFKSKAAAGQNRTSPHSFSGIGANSPLLFLTRGYAVLDGPTMPIIAEGDGQEPNDTYVEQLVASARAAVDEVVGRGVVDPARVAVGGHSYGAFMTANLLAHAPELFSCGIARSGAYNRTLTPFGFQAEERTLWQAPDTYSKMSPFQNAHKITKPILLIHGKEDKNIGTWPLQSERFYGALQGHGAVTRLVLLPHERHGYQAHESIMHTLYEMDAWMEAHNS